MFSFWLWVAALSFAVALYLLHHDATGILFVLAVGLMVLVSFLTRKDKE